MWDKTVVKVEQDLRIIDNESIAPTKYLHPLHIHRPTRREEIKWIRSRVPGHWFLSTI